MAPIEQQKLKEICPLKSWEELLHWKKPEYHIDEIVYGKKLQPRHPPYEPGLLKTLVCHDMKGGYLDDRFYSGSRNEKSYRFYQWSGVDSFIYFSHHLVTIPPPCWVSAAHLHGVRVLGTFITEWDAGAEICNFLLASEDSVKQAVSQLVDIAEYHHFEGWLINIENKIDSEKVDALVDFTKQLTLSMKELCSDAVVLWYDSVTREGKLEWQNELNDLNRCFFDACDGIFLNYTWSNDHLCRSRRAAGNRNGDVYVGLDVFGRNFYEGGKFNTHKAMELARVNELSAAIFAQGWTYETQENFEEAEDKLWRSLSPYLFHHGPKFLPFTTSFCQGVGLKKFCEGQCFESSTWYNLCNQQYQPIWPHEEGTVMKMTMSEPFTGGGCLELSTSGPATVRLFVCDINWKKALNVSLIYKWLKIPVPLSYILHFTMTSKDLDVSKERIVTLPLEGNNESEVTSGSVSSTSSKQLHSIEKIVDVEIEGWLRKTFTIPEEEGIVLQEISVKLEGASTIFLGSLDIKNTCLKGPKK